MVLKGGWGREGPNKGGKRRSPWKSVGGDVLEKGRTRGGGGEKGALRKWRIEVLGKGKE